MGAGSAPVSTITSAMPGLTSGEGLSGVSGEGLAAGRRRLVLWLESAEACEEEQVSYYLQLSVPPRSRSRSRSCSRHSNISPIYVACNFSTQHASALTYHAHGGNGGG
eukprot:COSAG06_NODE_1492_length_9279_cov_835.540632_3_plen_108_part_00